MNSPGLAWFDPMNEVIVATDDSGYGLGRYLIKFKTIVSHGGM